MLWRLALQINNEKQKQTGRYELIGPTIKRTWESKCALFFFTIRQLEPTTFLRLSSFSLIGFVILLDHCSFPSGCYSPLPLLLLVSSQLFLLFHFFLSFADRSFLSFSQVRGFSWTSLIVFLRFLLLFLFSWDKDKRNAVVLITEFHRLINKKKNEEIQRSWFLFIV